MAFPPYILREKDLKLQRRARGEGGSWPNLESKGGGAGNQPWTRLNNGGGPRGGGEFTHEDEKKIHANNARARRSHSHFSVEEKDRRSFKKWRIMCSSSRRRRRRRRGILCLNVRLLLSLLRRRRRRVEEDRERTRERGGGVDDYYLLVSLLEWGRTKKSSAKNLGAFFGSYSFWSGGSMSDTCVEL